MVVRENARRDGLWGATKNKAPSIVERGLVKLTREKFLKFRLFSFSVEMEGPIAQFP